MLVVSSHCPVVFSLPATLCFECCGPELGVVAIHSHRLRSNVVICTMLEKYCCDTLEGFEPW